MNARRFATGVAVVVTGAVIAGCSSPAPSLPTGQLHQPRATSAAHWWSSTDYCGILRQTMQAGHSILAGTAAGDPALLVATKAFVSDLTAAAPNPMRAQWHVLGSALTELVGSGGKLSAVSGVNSRAVAAAATAVATDAKTRCHVDVSA